MVSCVAKWHHLPGYLSLTPELSACDLCVPCCWGFALISVGMSMCGIDSQDYLLWGLAITTLYGCLGCGKLTPQSKIHPSGLRYLLRGHFRCYTCGTNQVFCCDLKPATGCAYPRTPCNGLLWRPKLSLLLTGPGLPSSSYKAIHIWSLFVLDLEVYRRG